MYLICQVGTPTGVDDDVYLPPVVATSGERITTDGLYLLDTGTSLMLYIGMDVKPSVMEEVINRR